MKVIHQNQLSPSAVFPQCVDNQYVSPRVFFAITSGSKKDFLDREIDLLRQEDVQTELIRSLIYSSQVVINRAYMSNNHLLFRHYLPGSQAYSEAYVELAGNGVILPLLFQHIDPDEGLDAKAFQGSFQTTSDGTQALHHLISTCGDSMSVLALAETKNQAQEFASVVAAQFEAKVDATYHTAQNEFLRSNMYSDVFGERFLDESNQPVSYDAGAESFSKALLNATELTNERRTQRRRDPEIGYTSRNDIYASFLVSCKCGKGIDHVDCSCIVNGRFDPLPDTMQRNATFGAKTLVDLVYAAGIPDQMQRYVFTPKDLPTRNALQDYGAADPMHVGVLDDVAKTAVERGRSFHANMNEAFILPELADLDFQNVLEIRDLPAWRPFIDAQNRILDKPLQAAGEFKGFQESFMELQNAIAEYYKTLPNREDIRATKYFTFVSGAITVFGDVIRIGVQSLLGESVSATERVVIDRVIQRTVEYGRGTVAVGPAKLMFEFMDTETNRVVKSLSWSVDWISSQVAWEKQDLLAFLNDVKAKSPNLIEPTPGLANAGTC